MSFDSFIEKSGSEIKKFGSEPPKKVVCRKKVLGEDFPCECEECKEKTKSW